MRYRQAVFDFRQDRHVASPMEAAQLDSVLLFDGVFLHRPELREYWDLSIFVDVSFATALAGAQERDVAVLGSADAVRMRYETRYLPAQQMYLDRENPRARADIVFVNDDPHVPIVRYARR